jgi:predicted RNA-binding protein with PIN domain
VSLILVDGHNVMFAWEGIRQAGLRDPRAGRQRVVEAAARYQAQRPGRKVVVVFDGRDSRIGNVESSSGVKVIYSRPPQNADMVIREMVEALKISPNPSFPKGGKEEEVWVVSSDREVQAHAKACGAKVFGAKAFESEMMGHPSSVSSHKGGSGLSGKSEKPGRMRKKDVDFWLKAMSEKRLDG